MLDDFRFFNGSLLTLPMVSRLAFGITLDPGAETWTMIWSRRTLPYFYNIFAYLAAMPTGSEPLCNLRIARLVCHHSADHWMRGGHGLRNEWSGSHWPFVGHGLQRLRANGRAAHHRHCAGPVVPTDWGCWYCPGSLCSSEANQFLKPNLTQCTPNNHLT